jgi:hypothetical protein
VCIVESSNNSTSLREGLPRNFLSYMGTMHQLENCDDGISMGLPEGLKQAAKVQQDRALAVAAAAASHHVNDESNSNEQVEEEAMLMARERLLQVHRQKLFKEDAKKRIMRVSKQAMSLLDDACDEIGKRFLSDRLTPALLETEKRLTKDGGGDSSHHHHYHDSSKRFGPTLSVDSYVQTLPDWLLRMVRLCYTTALTTPVCTMVRH